MLSVHVIHPPLHACAQQMLSYYEDDDLRGELSLRGAVAVEETPAAANGQWGPRVAGSRVGGRGGGQRD